uniref:Uncharacterized protein n=1 Tax=Sphaerodactylus townsendi TaxID=933632 RepID=A0ACB8FV01_9SAUR
MTGELPRRSLPGKLGRVNVKGGEKGRETGGGERNRRLTFRAGSARLMLLSVLSPPHSPPSSLCGEEGAGPGWLSRAKGSSCRSHAHALQLVVLFPLHAPVLEPDLDLSL